MADEFVTVDGGSNRNNYANVDLIVKVARKCSVDAVWPGWGHASENPQLPFQLAYYGIAFLGPPASAMDAVGDKICANILAQSCNVNVIPWSGSGLTVLGTEIPGDILDQATLSTVDEAENAVKNIGFPVMIKASEGGGGKGIRKVNSMEDLRAGFAQVQAEVPGSPIFIQKLSVDSRHLEVQMVADKHGQAIALYGRDCSVQRRHQKIIEEGPITIAPRALCEELERGAVRLAKKVGYCGVGTVEYLYNIKTGEYSFLEVNPRLQVEHPVTEQITGVNLPAVQLQLAMGIPLNKIPDVRRFFKQDDVHGVSSIDFDNVAPIAPLGHCVAGRITAENPDSGFKPTSGTIHELHFRSLPGVNGSFSIGTSGGVHQFADSQFGHVFAIKPTREEAITLLAHALSELSVRGEIHCNKAYLIKLLEKQRFIMDEHDTAWLDGLIAANDKSEPLQDHIIVACGAVLQSSSRHQNLEAEVAACLNRGVPPEPWMTNLSEHKFELIYNDIKYSLRVTMGSETSFYLHINGALIEAEVMELPDGGLKVLLNGQAYLVYPEQTKVGVKIHVNGRPCFFPDDFDATKLVAQGPGKLLKFLVEDGERVVANQPYCEIEVMKTVMPLIATSTGIIRHIARIGAILEAGDVLCNVDVEDVSGVQQSKPFTGNFTRMRTRSLIGMLPDDSPLARFTRSNAGVVQILAGYDFNGDPLEVLFDVLGTLPLVVDDFMESREAVISRAKPKARDDLREIAETMSASIIADSNSDATTDAVSVAVSQIRHLIDEYGADFAPLAAFCERHSGGLAQSRARVVTRYLETFLDVEEPFSRCGSTEDAIMFLRDRYRNDVSVVAKYAHANAKLKRRSDLIAKILDQVSFHDMIDITPCHDAVVRCMNLSGRDYEYVAQTAREIIVRKQEITRKSRRARMAAASRANRMSRDESFSAFAQLSIEESRRKSRRSGSLSKLSVGSESDLLSDTEPASASESNAESSKRYIGNIFLDSHNSITRYQSYENIDEIADELLQAHTWESLFDSTSETSRLTAIETLFAAAGVRTFTIPNARPEPVPCEPEVVRLALDDTIHLFAPSLGHAVAALPDATSSNPKKLHFIISYHRLVGRNDSDIRAAAEAFVTGQYLAGALKCESLEHVIVTLLALDAKPHHFTFERVSEDSTSEGFVEMPSARGFWPHVADQLEVERLALFRVECVGLLSSRTYQRHTNFVSPSEYTIGVFLAEEPSVKLGHKQPQRDRRVFLRAAVYNKDLLFESNASLDGRRASFDAVRSDARGTGNAHDDSVFADVLGSLELAVGRHRTAANHVFINLVGADAEDDLPSVEGAISSFIHHAFEDLRRLKVACVEVRIGTGCVIAENTSGLRFKIAKSMDCCAKREVHPLLNKIQRKRMACQNLSSTYVYDFPEVFSAVNSEMNPGVGNILDLAELILDPDTGSLTRTDRAHGLNDVGMVCWRVSLATREYPLGREIILVANDITHMSGSLSPPEDAIYRAAFDLAVEEGLPCVYLSSNSGARIGLDEAVKAAFRVRWVDDTDVSKGFKYIYLSEDDYEILSAKGRVKANKIVSDDEVHYALTDVCGGQSVECLQGSGEIAAATSRAYKSTVTIAYVTGRSVGIGAYCSRLCQRVVQQVDAPLILTGASALNKVLGREVYTSNAQIGGSKVMGSNGVSHLTVLDDVGGVRSILQWLSYIPRRRGEALPFVSSIDPVRRFVTFNPPQSPYDPRELLESFFDAHSFMEIMPEWGRTVVTGRARLGGIPIGAVAVETRTVNKTIPADPAFASAQIAEESQAGQVWFPDSAFKTAQAIGDMNREGLPLIIFANWRGFAGGLRDMYGEVLKYGAYIVDALREYNQPVFVYIPQGGELRGGAWVVIDSSINPEQMEFYAAEGARGGVLEPEGIVDIKFRRQDLLATMKRTVPGGLGDSHDDDAKKQALMPTFKQLAVHFAALHDTPGVMLHKKAIKDIVPWEMSRQFFTQRLRARLAENRIKTEITRRGAAGKQVCELLANVAHVVEEITVDERSAIEPERHPDVCAMLESIASTRA